MTGHRSASNASCVYIIGKGYLLGECNMRPVIILPLFFLQSLFGQEYLPKFSDSEQIVRHKFYTLNYDERHEQAKWVFYRLTQSDVEIDLYERTDKFLVDPRVLTLSANDFDYRGSGYDRGHMVPAADCNHDKVAMEESFYYSNMSPQHPSFNRGIWSKLEKQVRVWAVEYEELCIASGPVIISQTPKVIGTNNVAVPDSFYKVILDIEPEFRCIGFILPNEKCVNPLSYYARTVDQVERITGIDFFHSLPDSVENRIEAVIPADWPIEGGREKSIAQATPKRKTSSVQCAAVTKKGSRCSRFAYVDSKYCWQHQNYVPDKTQTYKAPAPSSGRCLAITKKGTRCKRKAGAGGYCWQHD